MGRTYSTSDWHGCGTIAQKVLNYLKEDDVLYYLGDCQDRGNDGLTILNALMIRPNTFYIQGNHDKMMADAIPYVVKDIEELEYPEGYGYELWLGNGGRHTLNNYEKITKIQWFNYRDFLNSCPLELIYNSPKGHSVILEHAGYTPFDLPHRKHDPLWDREHFYDKWNGSFNKENLDPNNTYLVHGHTPVQYLKFMYGYNGMEPLTKEEMKVKYTWDEVGYIPKIIRYCDGHKFDIDMCTIVSNRIALLDLDTFEEIYFDGNTN